MCSNFNKDTIYKKKSDADKEQNDVNKLLLNSLYERLGIIIKKKN